VSSEEEVDRWGNVIHREKPIVPVEELKCVHYFQYRIDLLEDGLTEPKIYIGVCRSGEEFKMSHDLSRQNDVWCINLATGDKFTGKKWKDYYNTDKDEVPRYGYFQEGTVIGVMLDMDRGILNFFKDGNDLG